MASLIYCRIFPPLPLSLQVTGRTERVREPGGAHSRQQSARGRPRVATVTPLAHLNPQQEPDILFWRPGHQARAAPHLLPRSTGVLFCHPYTLLRKNTCKMSNEFYVSAKLKYVKYSQWADKAFCLLALGTLQSNLL